MKKSLESTVTLLTDIVQRLELKGKKCSAFSGATEEDIENFWEVLQTVDSTLTLEETIKKAIKGKKDLEAFLDYCCVGRHYSFSIKKCGKDDCSICKPVRMPNDVFQTLRHLPDPMMGEDDHYLLFEQAYSMKTSEKDRPSLSNAKKTKALPFIPCSRHVQNVNVVVQCEECDLWRLLYSKTLGSNLRRCIVFMWSYISRARYSRQPFMCSCFGCYDPVEPLYYLAGFDPICVYCGCEEVQDSSTSESYPMCDCCQDRDPIKRK